MATVAEFIAALTASGELKNAGNTKTETALRNAIVRALPRLNPLRADWTEETFSFTSVADTAEYDSDDSGFPVDAVEFDVVEVQSGTDSEFYLELEPRTLGKVRAVLRGTASAANYPHIYAWYGQKLIFAPTFATAGLTVRGWYHRDARRDASTGTLIDATTASDSYTNPWFSEGIDPLWNKVLHIYHASFAVDGERAAYYNAEFQEARTALQRDWVRRAARGMRPEMYL